MTWQEVYKLPLRIDDFCPFMVWTADNKRAFDFINDIDEEIKAAIVDKLNGNQVFTQITPSNYPNEKFKYKDTIIQFGDYDILRIRGFGYLTGIGGLNLPDEEACEIQDEFGQYICDKLNNV